MNLNISLGMLLRRFWKKTVLTWLLVIFEALILLSMPLVMGWAVNDLLIKETQGIYQLVVLCCLLLAIGAGRRLYDTRVYSGIYVEISREMVSRENKRQTPLSKVSARVTLFTEFIEFLENSLPDIFNHLIGLTGTLVIIIFMDISVFFVCVSGTLLTFLIYMIGQKKMFFLNKGQNTEFEKQVDTLASGDRVRLSHHLKTLMKWNIRLSDFETLNFSLTWIILASVMVSSLVMTATHEAKNFGHILTLVMYIFGYIESVLTFPLYYQRMIRLQEIAQRLG